MISQLRNPSYPSSYDVKEKGDRCCYWACSYMNYQNGWQATFTFSLSESKKYRNPALSPHRPALRNSLKTKMSLTGIWAFSYVKVPYHILLCELWSKFHMSHWWLLRSTFHFGMCRKLLLFHYFQICPTVYKYSVGNGVGQRFASSFVQQVVCIGLFLFFLIRIV